MSKIRRRNNGESTIDPDIQEEVQKDPRHIETSWQHKYTKD